MSAPEGTFAMPSTLAEMLSCLQHITTTLPAQLVDQPRSTVEDAAKALRDNGEKQKALEVDLQQHQDYIQDVMVLESVRLPKARAELPSV